MGESLLHDRHSQAQKNGQPWTNLKSKHPNEVSWLWLSMEVDYHFDLDFEVLTSN